MAVQDEYLEALYVVKKWDAETWIACKAALKRQGILRETEKELKRRRFQVIQDHQDIVVSVNQELEKLKNQRIQDPRVCPGRPRLFSSPWTGIPMQDRQPHIDGAG